MWFSQLVPYSARGTLYYDLRSATLSGVFMGTTALLPMVVKKTLGASDWEVAVLIGAPVAGHLLSIYWARLCYHRPKMPFVLWSGLVSRGMFFLLAFLTTATPIVLVAAVSSFVATIGFPAINAIQRHNYPRSHRYRAVGTVMTLFNFSALASSWLVGRLLVHNVWFYRWLFPLAALFGLASTLIFARIKVRGERRLAEEAPPAHSTVASFRILLDNRPFGLYMMFQMITGMAFLISSPALISYLYQLHVPYDQAAIVLSVIPSALLIVTLPVWSRILQHMEPMQSRNVLCLFWGAGFLILGLSRNITMIYVGQVVLGLASGGGALLWTLAQMHYASKKEMPLYSGVHATLTGIRGIVAPLLGAWLLQVTRPTSVFFITAGLLGLGIIYPQLLRLSGVRGRDSRAASTVPGAGKPSPVRVPKTDLQA